MAAITDKPILKPVNPQSAYSVINSETRMDKEYKHLIKGPHKYIWMASFANELGYLYQVVDDRLPNRTEKIRPQVTVPQGTKSHTWQNCCGNTSYEVINTSQKPNFGG